MKFQQIISKDYRDIEPMTLSEMEQEAMDALRKAGFPKLPQTIELDERWHRFATDPSKKDDDAGWYIGREINGILSLSFGDWRDESRNGFYVGHRYKTLGAAERASFDIAAEQRRQQAEAERIEYQKRRAEKARQIWTLNSEATLENEYIRTKQLRSVHGARLGNDGSLILPMYNEDGAIESLQIIGKDGKRFLSGARVKGCFWWIGDPNDSRVFLAEGFATAASIYEATGVCTFISYSAGNLPAVAQYLADNGKEITIVADNDKSHAGEQYAEKAVAQAKCSMIVIPNMGRNDITDANDYVVKGKGNLSEILPDLKAVNKMLDISDIMSEIVKVRWFIKGWIPMDSIGMIHGPSASGKTNIALDMLLSLAADRTDWHGFKVSHPAKIVYLCGEGLNGVKLRIKAWAQVHGMETLSNMKVYPFPLDLDEVTGVAEIKEQIDIQSWRPDIIVIDTVNRYMSGDENSSQDTRRFLNAVDTLRRIYNCSGIYIHHTGNDENAQKRARGSSAWRGALDWEMSVNVDDKTKVRCIEQVKMKDAELIDKVYGNIIGVPIEGLFDEDGDQITGAVFEMLEDGAETPYVPDKALMKAVGDLMVAYSSIGDGHNHIRTEDWASWMVFSGRAKDLRAASKTLSDNRDDRPIGKLISAGILSREEGVWTIAESPETRVPLMTANVFFDRVARQIYT